MARGTFIVLGAAAVLLLISVAWFTRPAGADHLPPTGDTAIPPPPAVLVFRGNTDTFTNDKQHWFGHTGFDGSCEGLIRQKLGLLDANGALLSVPAGQRITVGQTVVGFTNAAGTYRAYNIDVVPFSTAFDALNAGDSLYICGHGGYDSSGQKGGIIRLGGQLYDGFQAPGFADGTAASSNPPYPTLPTPPGDVTVHIHACFSARDPDGQEGPERSVAATLDAVPRVAVVTGHEGKATVSYKPAVLDGPNPDPLTQAEKTTAEAAMANGLSFFAFPDRYRRGQETIDEEVPPPGNVLLHLTYGDTGEEPDPPGESTDYGCLDCPGGACAGGVGGIGDFPTAAGIPLETGDTRDRDLGSLFGIVGGALVVAVAVSAAVWYVKRRPN